MDNPLVVNLFLLSKFRKKSFLESGRVILPMPRFIVVRVPAIFVSVKEQPLVHRRLTHMYYIVHWSGFNLVTWKRKVYRQTQIMGRKSGDSCSVWIVCG